MNPHQVVFLWCNLVQFVFKCCMIISYIMCSCTLLHANYIFFSVASSEQKGKKEGETGAKTEYEPKQMQLNESCWSRVVEQAIENI